MRLSNRAAKIGQMQPVSRPWFAVCCDRRPISFVIDNKRNSHTLEGIHPQERSSLQASLRADSEDGPDGHKGDPDAEPPADGFAEVEGSQPDGDRKTQLVNG